MKSLFILIAVVIAAAAGEEGSCVKACPEIYAPVCSTDKQTLPNVCHFQVYQCERQKENVAVAIAHAGKCTDVVTGCPTACPSIYGPVCGSDGVTYDNGCKLETASCEAFHEDGVDIHLDHAGPCVESKSAAEAVREERAAAAVAFAECPIFCPSDWKPVCATNGKTYTNPCRLGVANCRSLQQDGSKIETKHAGVCGEPRADRSKEEEGSCFKPCSKLLQPFCASNGKTLGNKCLFEIYRCQEAKNGNDDVILVHDGPCKSEKKSGDECRRVCSKIFAPVCTSDGKTLSNKCLFENYRCLESQNGNDIILVKNGPCKSEKKSSDECQRICSKIFAPVCASDGKTLSNKCLFENYRCLESQNGNEVILVKNGPC